jgi:uncharacterized protein (DUF58 family)
MPRRTFLPLLIGLLALLVGLLRFDGGIIALSVPPLLLSLLTSASSLGGAFPSIDARRTPGRLRPAEGEEITIDLRIGIQEQHSLRGGMICVHDPIPLGARWIEGETAYIGPLHSGRTVHLSYRVELPRGAHPFRALHMSLWSVGGLFHRHTIVPLPTTVVAHPRMEPLRSLPLRPRRTRAFAGPVKARQGGQGIDLFGCRSYVAGDDARRINWRAYARTGQLVVNEYELERVADVNLIVDARQHTHESMGAENTFDHTVRAAASLARHLLSAGNIVGLLVYGTARWVPSGTGVRQEHRILEALATAHPMDLIAFEDLRNVPTRRFPAQSQLVFISPLSHADDVEIISLLVQHGYSVVAVCLHAASWERQHLRTHPAAEIAIRMASLDRLQRLDALARTGVQVVNWDVATPLSDAVDRAFSDPLRRWAR